MSANTSSRTRTVGRCRSALALAISLTVALPATAHASTVISIGATGSAPNAAVTALQKWPYTHNFADDPVTDVKVVNYPASLGFIGIPMGQSVTRGAVGLDTLLDSTPGRKIVVCESQGCLSVTELLQQYLADPATAPMADDVIIVMVGNPATAGGGVSSRAAGHYQPFFRITFPGATPESPYETFNVTREYDFYADQPSDSSNGLAMLNSVFALFAVHPFYGNVDMDDPDNLIKVVGNTTYMQIPTHRLPLLAPLYSVAIAWKNATGQTSPLRQVEAIDAQLRETIDEAYDRSDYVPQGSPGQGLRESAAAMDDSDIEAGADQARRTVSQKSHGDEPAPDRVDLAALDIGTVDDRVSQDESESDPESRKPGERDLPTDETAAPHDGDPTDSEANPPAESAPPSNTETASQPAA